MAIDLTVQYPGKIGPATGTYPYGEPRNVTTPGDGTGTPWEQAIVKETEGFKQALLTAAGVVPNGTPDAVGASQYLQTLVEQIAGRATTYIATGIGDAIVLSPGANQEAVQSLYVGLTVEFIAIANNTGVAMTVNVAGLGVVPLLNNQGGVFLANQFIAGQHYKIRYDGVNFIINELTYYNLTVPVLLLTTGTPATVNTAINDVTLNNAMAVRANVQVQALSSVSAVGVGTNQMSVHMADNNVGTMTVPIYRVANAFAWNNAIALAKTDIDSNEVTIGLDSNFDFWYNTVITDNAASAGTETITFVLKGYWA